MSISTETMVMRDTHQARKTSTYKKLIGRNQNLTLTSGGFPNYNRPNRSHFGLAFSKAPLGIGVDYDVKGRNCSQAGHSFVIWVSDSFSAGTRLVRRTGKSANQYRDRKSTRLNSSHL